MSTGPDSVTYTQSIGEVGGPVDAVSWQSTARPALPLSGMYGYAADLDDWEFRVGSSWLHAAWLDKTTTQSFVGPITINTAGAAPITLSSGIISVPASQSLSVQLQTAAQTITFGAPTAGLGNALTITPQSGGNTAQSASPNLVAAGNMLQSPFYQTPNSGYSITGDVNWVPPLNLRGTITGTNTAAGSTGPAFIKMSGTYSGSMSSGIFNMLGIYENASGFDGALTGVKVQLATTGTSSLSSSTFGLIATEFVAIANHNMGGISTGYGVTQFGTGVLFGSNPRALNKAGTYLAATVAQESAGAIYSGSQSGYLAVHQFVLEDNHAVHGITRDCLAVFGAQANITAGVREIIEIGGAAVHWPGDPNGYLIGAHFTATAATTLPVTSAGGFDANDVAFTGTGTWGGGFILRGEGAYVIPSTGNGGAFRAGHVSLASTATGGQISVDQDKMTGTPAINAAGTNWSANHIAGDVYGNVVQIATVSAGAVTGITVLRRGWVPTGTGGTTGVAFTCKNVVGGTLGQGLTLNLTWTAQNALSIQPTAGKTIFMPALQASTTYANDVLAAAGGVAVGQLYRNGSVIQCRIV
jgi:hypothetical protein